MKSTRALAGLPPPALRALAKLGADLSIARRRRHISTQSMAERTFTSRATIARAEKGDPRVSMAIYASALFVLGLIDRLAELADPAHDAVGLDLDAEQLPRRIRARRRT
jgi:transcriptional regulator with XRE-family HTH domain